MINCGSIARLLSPSGCLCLSFLVRLRGKTAYELNDRIDLLLGEVSTESWHVSFAVFDYLAQEGVVVSLNLIRAQVGNTQTGAHLRAFSVFGMAG